MEQVVDTYCSFYDYHYISLCRILFVKYNFLISMIDARYIEMRLTTETKDINTSFF